MRRADLSRPPAPQALRPPGPQAPVWLVLGALITGILLTAAAPAPLAAADAEELRAAELAFAASVAERDRDAFAAFLDDEAVFIGNMVLRGRQAIVEGWAPFFVDGGPRLEWHPELVEVRSDGLGLTRGPYTLTMTAADGGETSVSGLFTSIWRRDPEGRWKVLFDAGCPPCADATAPEG